MNMTFSIIRFALNASTSKWTFQCLYMGIARSWKTKGPVAVLAQAVCNRFLSWKGTDIHGKQLDPVVLSIAVKIERLKNGEIKISPQSQVVA
jgi:hypothetical protein